jgi:HCOMODA/2-hydroxy-3-carboxy-muconic semialdehyde decarboxylase
MSDLDRTVTDLVTANRILAHERVLDALGHVSVRHPENPQHFLLSRARSPELVEAADIMEFDLGGTIIDPDGRKPYLETSIHAAIYEAQPSVMSVVHSHALEVLPFSISSVPLRPVIHTAADIGGDIPVWDIRTKFGDTLILVTNMEQGRDLARCFGENSVVLMRGHGFAATGKSLADAVKTAIHIGHNARVLLDAVKLGGDITYVSPGEIEARRKPTIERSGLDRAWEYWKRRAGM